MRKAPLFLAIALLAGVAATQSIRIFVVQPIGAVPQGRTLVLLRTQNLNFIDSADAFCLRTQGSVNLLCRGMVLGTVVGDATILLRLPYSEALYSLSTGGQTFQR